MAEMSSDILFEMDKVSRENTWERKAPDGSLSLVSSWVLALTGAYERRQPAVRLCPVRLFAIRRRSGGLAWG
jgi:hypothetical protein